MNYYKFLLNDYDADLAYLNAEEYGVFMRLMHFYLRSEKPLPADHKKLARMAQSSSIDHVDAVAELFFTLDGDVYRCELAEQILQQMLGKSEDASKAGKASAKARKAKSKSDTETNSVAQPSQTENEPVEQSLNKNERVLNRNEQPLNKNERSLNSVEPPNNPITHIPNNPITHSGGGVQGGNSPTDHRQDSTAADADGAPPQASPPEKPDKSPPKAKAKRGTRLADDFVMPDTWITDAISWRPDLSRDQIRTEATAFCNYWQAKTGAGATKLDWHKTWHNWVLKAHAKPEKKVRSASEIKTFKETDWNAGLKHQNEDGTYAF